jgi:uncharacterized protein (TIGR00369 family)
MEESMSIVDQQGDTSPAAASLGSQLIDFDEEQKSVRVTFVASPDFLNEAGFIQGGFLVAMLDEAMGFAVSATSHGNLSTTSISISTDFLRPTLPGRILAEAKITSLGKSIVFLEAKLFNDAGKELARANSSCKISA